MYMWLVWMPYTINTQVSERIASQQRAIDTRLHIMFTWHMEALARLPVLLFSISSGVE